MTDTTQSIVDDLDSLMQVLTPEIQEAVNNIGRRDDLLEVIVDIGRIPTARYTDQEIVLLQREVTREDIDWIVKRIGDFDADNRAGITRTLHRISAIRNRKGHVVGLTCRVGRAVFGTIDIINDLIESDKSVLLLGRPGVGKTTMLREAARVLADKKRVVIVDTSNWTIDTAKTQYKRESIRAERGWTEIPKVLWQDSPPQPERKYND